MSWGALAPAVGVEAPSLTWSAIDIRLALKSLPGSGFQFSDFGFRSSGFGFRISGVGFRVSEFGFRVWG